MARTATRTTDDRRQQAPPLTSMASARAQMHARRPSAPDPDKHGGARRNQRLPKIRAPASVEHTHTQTRTTIAQQPTHDGKKRRPNERRARRARERDAALLIETRPTIPRESRDCERRACAQPNKLATGSKRERRCGECDERERDKARVSPTAPHDKDQHSPADETSKVSDERRAFVCSR